MGEGHGPPAAGGRRQARLNHDDPGEDAMRRLWSAFAAAALLLAAADGARAQETVDGGGGWRAGRFDLGVYAGGTLSSRWFESHTVTLDGTPTGSRNDDGESYSPGFAPAFGAFATYWLSPSVGVRAHGNYTPMRLPFTGDGLFGTGATDRHRYGMNTWFYDLDLMLRPFAMRGGMLQSMYLWVGGGGYTVDLAGEDVAACEGSLNALGACLSFDPKQATVGQGTAGVGLDLFSVGPLQLFTELGVHVYDSPVHVGDDWFAPVVGLRGSSVRIADDATAVTGRLVLGLKMVFGRFIAAPVPPPPPALLPPPPPREVVPPPPPAPVVERTMVSMCVVQDGQLTTIQVAEGEAPPAGEGYAGSTAWFVNNEPVTFMGRRYIKYGLPRVLGTTDVHGVGTVQGVSVFAEHAANTEHPEVIYVPVRPGCEFQPYQYETKAAGVRG
jgi:hypothetical protein